MTIKDIARESGYAVGTVSRVLNNQPGVSEEAHRRVMEIVKKYDINAFVIVSSVSEVIGEGFNNKK